MYAHLISSSCFGLSKLCCWFQLSWLDDQNTGSTWMWPSALCSSIVSSQSSPTYPFLQWQMKDPIVFSHLRDPLTRQLPKPSLIPSHSLMSTFDVRSLKLLTSLSKPRTPASSNNSPPAPPERAFLNWHCLPSKPGLQAHLKSLPFLWHLPTLLQRGLPHGWTSSCRRSKFALSVSPLQKKANSLHRLDEQQHLHTVLWGCIVHWIGAHAAARGPFCLILLLHAAACLQDLKRVILPFDTRIVFWQLRSFPPQTLSLPFSRQALLEGALLHSQHRKPRATATVTQKTRANFNTIFQDSQFEWMKAVKVFLSTSILILQIFNTVRC